MPMSSQLTSEACQKSLAPSTGIPTSAAAFRKRHSGACDPSCHASTALLQLCLPLRTCCAACDPTFIRAPARHAAASGNDISCDDGHLGCSSGKHSSSLGSYAAACAPRIHHRFISIDLRRIQSMGCLYHAKGATS